jgi:L-aminopeptidase/D-esterase-like protein
MTGMGKLKGGLGSASIIAANGATVGALVAVNSLGAVVAPGTRAFWATPYEIDGEFGNGAQRRWHNCARRAKIGWNKSRRAAERTRPWPASPPTWR